MDPGLSKIPFTGRRGDKDLAIENKKISFAQITSILTICGLWDNRFPSDREGGTVGVLPFCLSFPQPSLSKIPLAGRDLRQAVGCHVSFPFAFPFSGG